MNNILIILLVLTLLIGVLYLNKREKYGNVLGAAAPYEKILEQCLSNCDREDPDQRLQEHGNWPCSEYCHSMVTELARRGVDPSTISMGETTPKSCKEQCTSDSPLITNEDKRKCESVCQGEYEVAKWCKALWCPYRPNNQPEDECMKECILTKTTNNNQVSWTWLFG